MITEIDIRRTMKEKLNIDGKRYVILGACNPRLAHRALSADPEMGLLLPCNVIIYEDTGERTVLEAIDPLTMLDLAGDQPDIREVAADARKRLARVVDAVAAVNTRA